MREKFALFDANMDGVLTKDEIVSILTRPTSSGTRTFNTKMLNDFFLFLKFDECDVNGQGYLTIDEFMDALLPKEARVVFNTFDEERRGKVKAGNLPAMLEEFSMKQPSSPSQKREFDRVVSEAGIDSSFSYPQFASLAQKMRRMLKDKAFLAKKKAAASGEAHEESKEGAASGKVLGADKKAKPKPSARQGKKAHGVAKV
jgi:Ca2+-binding EF-hand superfamily protein